MTTLTGTQTKRHRLVRQPTTATTVTTVMISTVSGNHPPSNETPRLKAWKSGGGSCGAGIGVGAR